jgi:RNA polymerase sigma-70 factor (ECF subfamily)
MARDDSSDRMEVLVLGKRQFLRFLERRLGNPADAEDLLQAAYLKLVAQGDALRDKEKLVPWFCQILRNSIADFYRHRGAAARAEERLTAEADATVPVDEETFRAVCECVHDVLGTLKPDHAEILRRVELADETPHQAAGHLGITPNNASVRLHRARRALREGLNALCGVCTEHGCLDCSCRKAKPR